jgi:3-carboxy-cis,cis-muconate cycloisomerase
MEVIWSAEAQVRGMLAFEAALALALAEAEVGVIPRAEAEAIASICQTVTLDAAEIFREAAQAGTPAIPLVRMLTERMPDAARGFVHWGATSQDAVDTALVLQMRDGLDLLANTLREIGALCAALAERYADTPMAGRTLLQQALPITFGLKAARWLAMVTRQMRRLSEVREQIAVLQLGGAAGTLAALGDMGALMTVLTADRLGLAPPDLPWHAERDRVGEMAGALGVTAGVMAKIAQDVILLAQTEVGEVAEGDAPGKGGSSALAHKRNPIDAALAVAASRLAIGLVPVILGAMAQEHERGAGGWQTEWEAIPDLFRYCGGAAERVRDALRHLHVAPERMGDNLDRSCGHLMAEALTMALAASHTLGRDKAFRLVRELSEQARAAGQELREVAHSDERVRAALTTEQIDHAFEPTRYLGSTRLFIDRALAGYRALETTMAGDATGG